MTAGTFSGSGASLTSLNANNLQSGSVADARLTTSSLFATGMIMLWYGSVGSIPSGWRLCDGTNNTPDLRERFVVGAGGDNSTVSGSGYNVDATGGASTDTVTISGSDTVNISASGSGSVAFGANGTGQASRSGSSSATVSITVSGSDTVNISGSDTVNTLPPYYALCYIMKT